MTWAAEEFAGAQLGDARLNHRLIKLTERFADKPTASIPGACPDWRETQGAYRFFDQTNNAKRPLKWETVLAPHIERTEARMRQQHGLKPVAARLRMLGNAGLRGAGGAIGGVGV